MDWERVLEENLCIKKQLQAIRNDNDRLREEVGASRLEQEEALERYAQLSGDYSKLAKKQQMQVSAHQKDVASLTGNIQELKQLIDQKQLQLDNFQIKMIPNLDQDMVRVKLIAEMEGPYQEAIDKKDKQIGRLKDKLSIVERRQQLAEAQLETKEKQFKRELDSTKQFYEKESARLAKELNGLTIRKEAKALQRELVKDQRKQLEQLRCTIEMQHNNQIELRKQVNSLKVEKEKLLVEIGALNEKQAMEIYLSSENTQLHTVKIELQRVREESSNHQTEVERLSKKIKTIEQKHRVREEEWHRSQQQDERSYRQHRDNLQDQVRTLKHQVSRLEQEKDTLEKQLIQFKHSSEKAQFEPAKLKQQVQHLKDTIAELQRKGREFETYRKQKITLSKNIEKEEGKKENDNRMNGQKQGDRRVEELEKTVSRLKSRLSTANQKIVELLKEKASQGKGYTDARQRATSSIDFPARGPSQDEDKTLLLEYRDTGLAPLVRPTIFMHE